jgi:hypothetical protein
VNGIVPLLKGIKTHTNIMLTTRRYCLQTGMMVLGGPALPGSGATPKKPNIRFIAVDDLRPELACYGGDYIEGRRPTLIASRARRGSSQRAKNPGLFS